MLALTGFNDSRFVAPAFGAIIAMLVILLLSTSFLSYKVLSHHEGDDEDTEFQRASKRVCKYLLVSIPFYTFCLVLETYVYLTRMGSIINAGNKSKLNGRSSGNPNGSLRESYNAISHESLNASADINPFSISRESAGEAAAILACELTIVVMFIRLGYQLPRFNDSFTMFDRRKYIDHPTRFQIGLVARRPMGEARGSASYFWCSEVQETEVPTPTDVHSPSEVRTPPEAQISSDVQKPPDVQSPREVRVPPDLPTIPEVPSPQERSSPTRASSPQNVPTPPPTHAK